MRGVASKVACLVGLGVLVLTVVAGPASAAPAGVLDPTWGSGGVVMPHLYSGQTLCSFPPGGSYACGPAEGVAAIDAHDGRVYLASPYLPPSGPQQVAVLAYGPSGSLDPSFGHGGSVVFGAATAADDISLSHLVLQPGPNGTEYVGWYDAAGARIVRLAPNGSVDTSFASHGQVSLPTGTTTTPLRWMPMKAGPGGSLTIGFSLLANAAWRDGVLRLRPDGTPDPTFGAGGVVAFASPPAVGAPLIDLAVTGSGRVFALLGTRNGPAGTGAVVAITAQGALDPAFGNHGFADPFGAEPLDALAVDSAGRPLVMTSVSLPGSTQVLLVTRLRSDGGADPTFGVGGTFGLGLGGQELQDSQIALDAQGRPVLTLSDYDGRTTSAGVARLTPNGSLDPTFGPGLHPGVDLLPLPGFSALALGADGRIYLGASEAPAGPQLDPRNLYLIGLVANP